MDRHIRYMPKKLIAQEADEIIRRIRANPWLFASEFPPMEDFRLAEEWMEAVETIALIEMPLGPLTAEQIRELRTKVLH
jgi:hypothetical protein